MLVQDDTHRLHHRRLTPSDGQIIMRYSSTVGTVAVVCSLAFVGCGVMEVDAQRELTARTVLTSTSLSGDGSAAQVAAVRLSGADFQLTPDNVSGEILTFMFATAGRQDEGISVFGELERPDTAWGSAPLYPFDLAPTNQLAITTQIMVQPGFVGGTSEHAIAIFGYADFHLTLASGNQQVVRVSMVELGSLGMQRGDKLLADANGTFQWYDMDTQTFTSTRPNNPAVIEAIRDFTDPIRPLMVFYPLNVFLTSPVTLDPQVVTTASGLDAVVDFSMGGAVTLVGQTTWNVTDDVLITSFSLTQVGNWGNSGLHADAALTFW